MQGSCELEVLWVQCDVWYHEWQLPCVGWEEKLDDEDDFKWFYWLNILIVITLILHHVLNK